MYGAVDIGFQSIEKLSAVPVLSRFDLDHAPAAKRLKGAEVELWLPDPWLSGSGAELGRGNRAAECRGMGCRPSPA